MIERAKREPYGSRPKDQLHRRKSALTAGIIKLNGALANRLVVIGAAKLQQVGWWGPDGIVPGGLGVDDRDGWEPVLRLVPTEPDLEAEAPA